MVKISIPKITDEELLKRYSRIKPIVSIGWEMHWLREYNLEELKTHNFFYCDEDVRDMITLDDGLIHPRGWTFWCVHEVNLGFLGPFNPRVADVLAQIDEDRLQVVRAFEIKKCDLSHVPYYFYYLCKANSMCVSEVTLYR